MKNGIVIRRLNVNAFRGIPNPIAFDFSAPITLIYAPNGTGKTTLCEAAEWLLSGRVERLREKGRFDASVLRSRFDQSKSNPRVEADIVVGDTAHRLLRTAQGSDQQALLDGTDIGENELLAKLAPAAAAEETNHIRAISLRQGWLRGTRFLTAEALAALVDSDEGTIERRTQVFADIFGIRHLLEAEKQLDIYAKDLAGQERPLAQQLEFTESEIDKIKQELQEAPTHGSDALDTLLSSAGELVGLTFTNEEFNDQTIAERLQQITAEVGRRQHQLDNQEAAIAAVVAEWEFRREGETRVQELERIDAAQAPQLEAQKASERLGSAQLAEMSARRETLDLRRDQLRLDS